MANSVDPDQTAHPAASDLGLHCLQRPSSPILRVITIHTKQANRKKQKATSTGIKGDRSTSIKRENLIVLGFNDTSILVGYFVSLPREREKRDKRDSRGDEREGQGRKRNRNESKETEEIKTFALYPYLLKG